MDEMEIVGPATGKKRFTIQTDGKVVSHLDCDDQDEEEEVKENDESDTPTVPEE